MRLQACVCVWPCNPQKEGALNRANLTSQAGRKSVPSYQFGPAKVGAISRVAGWEQKIVEMRELISRFFCCPRGMPAGREKEVKIAQSALVVQIGCAVPRPLASVRW